MSKIICIIRIRGRVGLKKEIAETLYRLRLRRKYSCVVINSNEKNLSLTKKIKDFVAFGEINDKTFEKLVKSRGQLIDKTKKIEVKKVCEELKKGKKYKELNLKPFFRLHPPRGGINSKIHFPKGILGNNKEKINELVVRML